MSWSMTPFPLCICRESHWCDPKPRDRWLDSVEQPYVVETKLVATLSGTPFGHPPWDYDVEVGRELCPFGSTIYRLSDGELADSRLAACPVHAYVMGFTEVRFWGETLGKSCPAFRSEELSGLGCGVRAAAQNA